MTPGVLIPLFIISFTESCCFVIAPDFVFPFLMIGKPLKAALALIAFTSFASLCGAAFGYGIGKWGGQPLLHKLFKREKTDKVERYFQKYDVWAVGLAAFTPIPYKVFTVSSGVFNMNFTRFMIVSALARSARYLLVGMICYWLLKDMNPQQVIDYLSSSKFAMLTSMIGASAVLLYIVYRAISNRKKKAKAAA